MTEQELREKIVEVIRKRLTELVGSCRTDKIPLDSKSAEIVMEFANELADALIVAVIGDVKEAKFESDHFWRMWQGALVELERAKHREEVLKKAFKKYLEKEACRFCNYKKINYCEAIKESQEDCFNATVETYIKQAEKELQKERKDVR